MPKGNPTKRTLRTERYHQKAGYTVKSFKMKRDIVEEFTAICDKKGISQAAWLTEKMMEFIEENRKEG